MQFSVVHCKAVKKIPLRLINDTHANNQICKCQNYWDQRFEIVNLDARLVMLID